MNGTRLPALRSKQRPDTLMQDRIYWIAEIFLHRTAGPYNWVIFDGFITNCRQVDVRFCP